MLRQAARSSVRTMPTSKWSYSSSISKVLPTKLSSSLTSVSGPQTSPPSPPSYPTTSPDPTPGSSQSPDDQRKSELHIREQLQSAVLERIPTLGWTNAAVRDALASLGLSSASAALLPAGPASVVANLEADCNRLLAEHLHARIQRAAANTPTGVTNTAQTTSSAQPLPRTLPPSQAPITGSANAVLNNESSPGLPANSEKLPKDTSYPHTSPGSDEFYNESPSARAAYAMIFRLRLLDPYHQFWYQAVALRARTPRTALRNRLLLTDEVAAYASYNTPDVSQVTFMNCTCTYTQKTGRPIQTLSSSLLTFSLCLPWNRYLGMLTVLSLRPYIKPRNFIGLLTHLPDVVILFTSSVIA